MKALCCLPDCWPPSPGRPNPPIPQAIRKAIATFNHAPERATVLARDADLSPLDRFAGQEVSQVYFETTAIRFVTPDVAFVDATASQFGSVILKRSSPRCSS